MINLIHQGTGPIFQAQYGLPPLTGAGGIGEESRRIREPTASKVMDKAFGSGSCKEKRSCLRAPAIRDTPDRAPRAQPGPSGTHMSLLKCHIPTPDQVGLSRSPELTMLAGRKFFSHWSILP